MDFLELMELHNREKNGIMQELINEQESILKAFIKGLDGLDITLWPEGANEINEIKTVFIEALIRRNQLNDHIMETCETLDRRVENGFAAMFGIPTKKKPE